MIKITYQKRTKLSGIYCIKNDVTGKLYIGSSKHVELRLIHQKSFLKTGHPCMIAALKGMPIDIDDFDFKIVAETKTIEEARELETAFLECFWGDWLYNKAVHANGPKGVKRDYDTYSAGAKKQWSDPEFKKRMATPEHKAKLSLARKKGWEKRRKLFTPEYIAKISLIQKKAWEVRRKKQETQKSEDL